MIKTEIVKLLDSMVMDFFPKEGNWKSNCFKRERIVSDVNLPCHLRDVDWLSSLLMKKYDLYSLGEGVVREYVRDSSYFHQLRSEYEQRIVKWQIEWMRNDGSNWLVDSKYGGEFYLFSPMCDYAFRKGIVDTLLAIGMDRNAIEEGIERNADMWLDTYMNLAFLNQYDPIFSSYRITLKEDDTDEKLQDIDPVFKENWLKYRKYQYYQEHKESVEAYGVVMPEMKMSKEEVEILEHYLTEQGELRQNQIAEFEKKKQSQELSILKQMSESAFYGLSYEDCLPKKQKKEKPKRKVFNNVFGKIPVKRH